MYCKNCGREIPKETIVCPYCKYDLVNGGYYSPNKKAENSETNREKENISFSGDKIDNLSSSQTQVSKKGLGFSIAALILLVIGTVLFMALFCVTFVSMVWRNNGTEFTVMNTFYIITSICELDSVFVGVGLIFSIIGVICSAKGLKNAKRQGGKKGVYIAGLIIGIDVLVEALESLWLFEVVNSYAISNFILELFKVSFI